MEIIGLLLEKLLFYRYQTSIWIKVLTIFNRFADLTCWIIQNILQLRPQVHYADDYFLGSSKHKELANSELEIICQAFHGMNIPLAEDKILGPATKVIYLGIEIDSTNLTISVPADKYNELMVLLPSWLQLLENFLLFAKW